MATIQDTCDEDVHDGILMMDPHEIGVRPPFSVLFPISPDVRDSVVASMKEDGYDFSRPINVWRKELVVVDGHTRREAAIACGIIDIPVCFHDFASEDEAVIYAIKAQVERRNLTDAEIYRVTLELDRRKPEGRPLKETTSHEVVSGSSSNDTAKKVRISRAKVEAVRTIHDHATEYPDIAASVVEGKKSIRAAAREVGDRKRKASPNYVPVIIPEAPKPVEVKEKIDRDEETQAWLESHPLRGQAVTHRFDEDALICKNFADELREIGARMRRVVGERSPATQTPIYAAVLKAASIPPVSTWFVCKKCNGTGIGVGLCRACRGCGYSVPGF